MQRTRTMIGRKAPRRWIGPSPWALLTLAFASVNSTLHAQTTPPPCQDAAQAVSRFQDTLTRQFPFSFEFTNTCDVDHRARHQGAKNPQLEGTRTFHMRGSLAADGHQVALRMKVWGQYNGLNRPPVPEHTPQYRRNTYDGTAYWSYFKPRQEGVKPKYHAGRVTIYPGVSDKWHKENLGLVAPTRWLQGYISERGDRIDTLLKDARLFRLSPTLQTVNGIGCDVIDFASPYGQGTLWLAHEQGHLITQAQVNLNDSHLLPTGARLNKGSQAEYRIENASIEQVEGVWFVTQASVTSLTHTANMREQRNSRVQVQSIRIKEEINSEQLFARNDIAEGAEVNYIGKETKYRWLDDRIVPDSSRP